MAKIRNRKNCCYQIGEIGLTPEYGELEVSDERAAELCNFDGIEIVMYDDTEVPMLATSDPIDFDPIPDNDTKVESPKKKRGRPRGKRGK